MAFRMKGSPLLKDVKRWDANGDQITIDDSTLSDPDMDDDGNETIRYNYIDKSGNEAFDVLYKEKPRFGGSRKGDPVVPSDRPIDVDRPLA